MLKWTTYAINVVSAIHMAPSVAPCSCGRNFRYAANFQKEDIDVSVLRELKEEDLEKIGVTSIGARKKILNAVSERGVSWNAVAYLQDWDA